MRHDLILKFQVLFEEVYTHGGTQLIRFYQKNLIKVSFEHFCDNKLQTKAVPLSDRQEKKNDTAITFLKIS